MFNIIVADTGSSEIEKNNIKDFINNFDNIRLVEYDYYNFSKINNDVVNNHVGDDIDFLLFCNNDIKILNDVIHYMINVFEENPLAGTVGARLHFADNTIQHDGILVYYLKKNNHLGVTHLNFGNYYNYNLGVKEVIGNTGALLMIRKKTFIKCGMFNENYTECLEDVELNLKCVTMGYKNFVSNAVSYHYESQTRNEDDGRVERFNNDYRNYLGPFLINNSQKLVKYIKSM